MKKKKKTVNSENADTIRRNIGFLFNSFRSWWIKTKSRRLSLIPEVTLMRNTQSSLVFCDIITLLDKLSVYKSLVSKIQDFRPQGSWWKQGSATVGHGACTLHVPRMAVFFLFFLVFSAPGIAFPNSIPLHKESWLDLVEHWVVLKVPQPLALHARHWRMVVPCEKGLAAATYELISQGDRAESSRDAETTEGDRDRQRQRDKKQGQRSESLRCQVEQKPVPILSKPWAVFFKDRCGPAARVLLCWIWVGSTHEGTHPTCSACVLICLFYTATWRVMEIFLAV